MESSESVTKISPRKVRRSLRLAKRCPKPETTVTNPLGNFWSLPTEVQFKIFENLNLSGLGILGISSKALRDQVMTYLCLNSTIKVRFPDRSCVHIRAPNAACCSMLLIARQLGILVKRLTCLFPTKRRLEFVVERVLPPLDCTNPANNCRRAVGECNSPFVMGEFLQALSAGWVLSELILVVAAISDSTTVGTHSWSGKRRGVLGQVSTLAAVTEADPHWRHFHRSVYLDSSINHATEVFWLRAILHPLDQSLHAQVLFLLYGPCIRGEIKREHMQTTPVFCTAQGRNWFLELAKALAVMARYSDGIFTDQSLATLVEDMISRPKRWNAMNVAQLLFCCRRDLVCAVLVRMLAQGKLKVVGNILAMMALVNLLAGDNVNWLLDLLEVVLATSVIRNRFQLRTLYRHINDAFESEAMEMFEVARRENAELDIVRSFLRAITMFQIGITQMPAFKALI